MSIPASAEQIREVLFPILKKYWTNPREDDYQLEDVCSIDVVSNPGNAHVSFWWGYGFFLGLIETTTESLKHDLEEAGFNNIQYVKSCITKGDGSPLIYVSDFSFFTDRVHKIMQEA